MISHSELLSLLHYDAASGHFTWKVKRNSFAGMVVPGARAGSPTTRGYRQIVINQRRYKEHRLAWFYVHGEWAPGELDHKDRNPANNAICNLRPASRAQNSANMSGRRSAHGLKGAYRDKTGRWFSQISMGGKSHRLGRFDTPEEAHAAYVAAAHEYYGEFASAS